MFISFEAKISPHLLVSRSQNAISIIISILSLRTCLNINFIRVIGLFSEPLSPLRARQIILPLAGAGYERCTIAATPDLISRIWQRVV
jgi:hypothetical protein